MNTFEKLLTVLVVSIMVIIVGVKSAQSAEVDLAVDLTANGVYVHEDVLYVRGTTTKQQALRVLMNLSKHKNIKRVVLSGNGGDLMAGLSIGGYIRNHELPVQITSGTKCISACAFAALGAHKGKIMLGGQLLFHRGYVPALPVMNKLDDLAMVNQQISAITTQYILAMGYNGNFAMQIILSTNPCRFMMFDTTSEVRKMYNGEKTLFTGIVGEHEDWDYCKAAR